jgi:hypothetical protein
MAANLTDTPSPFQGEGQGEGGSPMSLKPVVVRMNRRWARWALVLAALGVAASAFLIFSGLWPGRPNPGTGWLYAASGLVGAAAFIYAGGVAIRALLSPWRLEVSPSHLALLTPAYDLRVPWEQVAGIALANVDRRAGCALVFEDAAVVAAGATFRRPSGQESAVGSAVKMLERMQVTFRDLGYHLGVPERVLELKPEALARLLTQAKTGELWQEATG